MAIISFCFCSSHDWIVHQGQTPFDVSDEDVLGYLEELQKKQNLVRVSANAAHHRLDAQSHFQSSFQLMSEKKDDKKSPLIETTTTGDNNQSLKPLKR